MIAQSQIPPQPPNLPQYIGKTAAIAATLWRQIPKLQTATDPCERRYLFTGPPGLGKTDLAEHLAAALAGDTYERVHAGMALNVESLNGQSCTVDVVRRWQDAGHYRPMFGACRVILVDEVDALSSAALNESRTYLDRMPLGTVFLATTNKPVNQLQEQLQSRFKVCYFETPKPAELQAWLTSTYQLPTDFAATVVQGAKGNVRAAKLDALAWREANACH
jgi:replication-associated recombination protein RarA